VTSADFFQKSTAALSSMHCFSSSTLKNEGGVLAVENRYRPDPASVIIGKTAFNEEKSRSAGASVR
jgi:hypothetical protein